MLLKLVVADNIAPFVDKIYQDPSLYSWDTLALASVAYAAQIFCDFHGYTLMAIGLALCLGIRLPENFRMPYISRSLSEFWHRWHISLSSWLRDYLYIPLGGSRGTKWRTQANLLATMALGGLWHGASWTFLLWGCLHGAGLIAHKQWEASPLAHLVARWPNWFVGSFSFLLTFLAVILLWIPFRSPDWKTMLLIFSRLFSGADGIRWWHTQSIILLTGLALWHVLYGLRRSYVPYLMKYGNMKEIHGVLCFVAILVIVLFAAVHSSPFIYFQF